MRDENAQQRVKKEPDKNVNLERERRLRVEDYHSSEEHEKTLSLENGALEQNSEYGSVQKNAIDPFLELKLEEFRLKNERIKIENDIKRQDAKLKRDIRIRRWIYWSLIFILLSAYSLAYVISLIYSTDVPPSPIESFFHIAKYFSH